MINGNMSSINVKATGSSSIPVVYDTSVKQQSHVQQPQFYPLSNCSSSSSTNYYDSDNTLRRKSSHNRATPSRLPSYSSTKNTRPGLISHSQPPRKCVSNHVTPISSPVVPAKSAAPINNARKNQYNSHSKSTKSFKKSTVTNSNNTPVATKDDNNNQFSQEVIDSSAQLIRDIDSTLTQLSEQYNSATTGEVSEPSSLVTTPTSLANNNIAEAPNKPVAPSNTNRSMLNKFKLKQQASNSSSGATRTPTTNPKAANQPSKKGVGASNSYTEAWLYNTNRGPGGKSQSSGPPPPPTSMMMQYMAAKNKHTKTYNNPSYQSSSSSGSELQINAPSTNHNAAKNEDSTSSTLTHSSRSGSKLPTTNSSSQNSGVGGTGLKFPQKYYVTNSNNTSNSNPSTLLMLHKKSPHAGDRDSGISSKDSSLSSSEHSNSGPGNGSSGKNSLPRPPPRVSSLPRQQNSSSTASSTNTKSVSKADRRRARELFASVKQRENNAAHKSSTSTLNSSNADVHHLSQSEDDTPSNKETTTKNGSTDVHQQPKANSASRIPDLPQHGTALPGSSEASHTKDPPVATSPTATAPPETGVGKKLEESYAEKMQQRFREGMLAVQESLQMTAAAGETSPTSSLGKSEVIEEMNGPSSSTNNKNGVKKGRTELCSSSSEEIEEYLRELSGRMSSYSSSSTNTSTKTGTITTTATGSSPTMSGDNDTTRSTTTGRMMRERMEKYVQEKYSDEFDITSSCSMDLLLSGVQNPGKTATSSTGAKGPPTTTGSCSKAKKQQEIMIEGAGPAPASMEHTGTILGHETMRGRASSLSSRIGTSQIRAMSLPGPHAQQMPPMMLPPQQALHDVDYADSLSLPSGSRPRTSSVSHSVYGPLSVRTVGGGGLDLTSSGVMSLPHHYNPSNRPRTALSRPLQGSNHQNYVYGHLQQSSNNITNANGGSYSTLANLKLPYSTNGSAVRPSTSSTSLGDNSSSYYGHVPSTTNNNNEQHYMTHSHNHTTSSSNNHQQPNGTVSNNNNNNNTASMYGSEDVYDGLGSHLSLLSTSSYRSLNEERQISEIRRLRRELEIAQQKVKSLSGQLSSNGNLVSAFESSLQNMSLRLHKFAATTESKENELNELKSTIQELKRQASVPSQHSNTTPRPSSSCSNTFTASHTYHGNNMSPPKLYAASSLTSLSSHNHHHHAHSLSQSKQHSSHNTGSLKKTSWLKNSLGKAFRKKSSSSSNKDEGSTESINEMHQAHRKQQASMSSMLESESMLALRKELEEKDARLTDVQLDALSRSHQLEQLRDLLTKMRYEMSSLKADNSRLQSLMMMMSSSSSSAASGPNTAANTLEANAVAAATTNAISAGESSPSKTGPKAKFDLINGLLHSSDTATAIVVYVSTRPNNYGRHSANRSDTDRVPPSLAQLFTQDSADWLPIGRVAVSAQTGWSDLDNQLKRLLKEFLSSVDPASALGLTGDAMYRYRINDESWVSMCGTSGGMRPLTSPCAALTCSTASNSIKPATATNCIQIQLKSHHYGNSIDDLVFHTLIPKQILQRYLGLLLEHRRVIICGPHGTGKSYLARQLALNLANRNTSPDSSSNQNNVFTVTLEHQRSSRDLRAYLSALTEQLTRCTSTTGNGCHDNGSVSSLGLSLPSTLPLVIVLENLHFVSSFTDVFSAFLALHNSNKSPYVIGTMNSSANNGGGCYISNSSNLWGNNLAAGNSGGGGGGSNGSGITSNLDVHHNFRWILLANHMEPVKGLLSRCLRKRMLLQQWRQLVPMAPGSCHEDSGVSTDGDDDTITSTNSNSASSWESLVHITDWLCIVWQHVNRFIESHGGSAAVTMGPRLFLQCPMDLDRARTWFLDLWNFSIVPYVIEAVKEGLRGHGRRQSSWEDPTEWVAKSWPWTFPGKGANESANLIRLRPEDVGFETYTFTNNTSSPSPVQHKHPGALATVAMSCSSPEPISDYHKSLPLPIPHLMMNQHHQQQHHQQQQQSPSNNGPQQLGMSHHGQMHMTHHGGGQPLPPPQQQSHMTYQHQHQPQQQQPMHMSPHPQYPYLPQQRIMTQQHPNQQIPNVSGYPPY